MDIETDPEVIAFNAYRNFEALIPQFESFVRNATGRKIKVRPGKNSSTDGTTIFIRPIFELGYNFPHNRNLCDRIDFSGAQRCTACGVREALVMQVYHEISHNLFGTFSYTYDDVAPLLSKYQLKRRRKSRETDTWSAYGSAQAVNFYLGQILNVMEDIRVDSKMFFAKSGLRRMMQVYNQTLLEKGLAEFDGSRRQYREYALDTQAIIFLYYSGRRQGFRSNTFAPEVIELENDAKLMELLSGIEQFGSVVDSYERAIQLLLHMKSLGFFLEKGVDDTPPPPPQPEDQESDKDESDEAGQAGDTASPGDQPGDGGDSDDQSEGSENLEDDREADGDGEGHDDPGESEESAGSGDSSGDPGDDSDGSDPASGDGDDESGEGEQEARDPEAGSGSERDSDSGDEGSDSSKSGDAGDDSEAEGDANSSEENTGSGVDSDADEQEAEESDQTGSSGSQVFASDDPGAESSDTNSSADDGADSHDAAPEPPRDTERADDGDPATQPPSDEADPVDTAQGARDHEPTAEELWQAYQDRHGSPEEISQAMESVLGHGHLGDEDHDETQVQEAALDKAARQSDHLDEPSASLAGVLVIQPTGTDWTPHFIRYTQFKQAEWNERMGDLIMQPADLSMPAMKLRRVFSDNKRSIKETNLTRGKINSAVLGRRAPVGDSRLFQTTSIPGKKDYAVTLAGDFSGSTVKGRRLDEVKTLIMAQADLLTRLGVKFQILGHSGGIIEYTQNQTPYIMPAALTDADRWGKEGVVLTILKIKDWDEPWNETTKERLRNVPSFGCNLDGHAFEYCRKQLQRRPEQRKVLMYYSDGQMPNMNRADEMHVLLRELALMEKLHMAVAAVGVQDNSPAEHGIPMVLYTEQADIHKVIGHIANQLGATV